VVRALSSADGALDRGLAVDDLIPSEQARAGDPSVFPLVRRNRAVVEHALNSSFDDFYRREYVPLLALSISLVGIRASAEDIVQDSMVTVSTDWARIQSMTNPGSWTRRIVINRSLSWRRRRGLETRALRLWVSSTPDEIGMAAEDDFWDGVRELPRRQAACIALYYMEDRPMPEIAEILGCAEATVRVHLFKARRALSLRFQDRGTP
jgi:RNA polymerase sigma factor (sigma-70 family)